MAEACIAPDFFNVGIKFNGSIYYHGDDASTMTKLAPVIKKRGNLCGRSPRCKKFLGLNEHRSGASMCSAVSCSTAWLLSVIFVGHAHHGRSTDEKEAPKVPIAMLCGAAGSSRRGFRQLHLIHLPRCGGCLPHYVKRKVPRRRAIGHRVALGNFRRHGPAAAERPVRSWPNGRFPARRRCRG